MQRLRHMVQSTAIVVFFFGISKITGFGKLILMTDRFGLSSDADALTAAIQVPDLFMQMVSGGALAAALIPVYSSYVRHKSKQEQRDLGSTVVTLVALVLGVVCIFVGLFAPWIASDVLVPHFSAESQQLVASLMRIVVLSMLIVGVSAVLSAMLHTHQHFVLPALADVVIDVGQILGILLFAERYGVFGVAWGGVIGALMHLFVQLPAVVRYGIKIRPKLALQLKGVREVLRLMGPRIVTIGGAQLSDIIIIRSASQLPEGSVSGYYYALLLIGIPVSLFGWAVGTVIFPTMAEQFNASDEKGLRSTATNGFLTLAALMFPAAVGLVALGQTGIQFIFERGEFDSSSTALMYSIVAVLSLRILSDTGLVVFERVFYARHNTKTVMWFSLLWFGLYVGSGLILIPSVGVIGLALSHSLSFVVSTLGMYIWLQRDGRFFDQSQMLSGLARTAFACLLMIFPIQAVQRLELSPIAYVAVAIPVAALFYLIVYAAISRRQVEMLLATARGMRAERSLSQ